MFSDKLLRTNYTHEAWLKSDAASFRERRSACGLHVVKFCDDLSHMPLNNFVIVGFYRIHRILPVLKAGGLTLGFDRMPKLVAQVLHI